MDDESLFLDRTEYMPSDSVGDSIPTAMIAPPDADQSAALDDAPALDLSDEVSPVAEQGALPAVCQAGADDESELTTERVVEALLFSADTPLSAGRLAELTGGCTPLQIRSHVGRLNEKYAAAGLTFRIESIARGYQMMTLPCYQCWLDKLNKQRSQTRLSAAALETLSIVAYKQPIIRADVEAIRGVTCGDVLNRLREMGLIKVEGRAEVVGRPLLYGTTRKFLDVFGLADLDDLPPMEALSLRRHAPPTEEIADEPAAESSVAASA